MKAEKIIINKPIPIVNSLAEIGLTINQLKEVALKAATAKFNTLPIDAKSAPGTMTYLYGVRGLRQMVLQDSLWRQDSTDNIESIVCDEKKISIVFQNVDNACSVISPKCLHEKKSASKRKIEQNAMYYLFDEMESEFQAKQNSSVWYFCVSISEDIIKAELSLPKSVDGTQLDFHKRIFILQEGDLDIKDVNPLTESESDDFDVDIKVTRK